VQWYIKDKPVLTGRSAKPAGELPSVPFVQGRSDTESSLLEPEFDLQTLLNSVVDGVLVADVETKRFAFANTAICEMLGYPADKLRSLSVRDIHLQEALPAVESHFEQILRTKTRIAVDQEVRRKDGSTFYARISTSLLVTGGRTYAVGIFHDITESRRHEEALRRLNRALRTLSSTNHALIHATGEQRLFEQMCQIAVEVGGYAMAWVGLRDSSERAIPVAFAGNGAKDYVERAAARLSKTDLGRGPTGTAMRTGETQINHSFAANQALKPLQSVARKHGYRSSIALPLKENGRVFGALTIYAAELDVFDSDEVRLLEELADDTGFGIAALRDREGHRAARQRLQHGLEVTVEALASTVERRDAYTAGHQREVSEIATAIAQRMGLPQYAIDGLRLASIIHDVGKIQVPAEILSKPGQLTPLEFALIKEHAQAGYDIVKDIDFPWPIADIILQHHERLDGSGYPNRLRARDILIEAKILAVADVIEAMMSHRPYRAALGQEAALAEIKAGKGTLFDPAAVDACESLFRESAGPAIASKRPRSHSERRSNRLQGAR
jgi:PAS domain S-box-containing protein/putative nucleotidyltransferase with HDIG domain